MNKAVSTHPSLISGASVTTAIPATETEIRKKVMPKNRLLSLSSDSSNRSRSASTRAVLARSDPIRLVLTTSVRCPAFLRRRETPPEPIT